MRGAKRWLGFSAVLACIGAATGACSSDDSTPSGTPDSGMDGTTQDGATQDGAAAEAATDSGPDGGDAGASDACVGVGASIAAVDAGATWSCIQSVCSSQLTACAADCACNNALLGALVCAGRGGDPTTCFTTAYAAAPGDPNVSAVVLSCLPMAISGPCGGEGGTDAGTEAGVQDGGSEAAPGSDAGADAATEAGGDSGTSDSPSGG